jgi:hypothetical protein
MNIFSPGLTLPQEEYGGVDLIVLTEPDFSIGEGFPAGGVDAEVLEDEILIGDVERREIAGGTQEEDGFREEILDSIGSVPTPIDVLDENVHTFSCFAGMGR